jgi:hypothetical protein
VSKTPLIVPCPHCSRPSQLDPDRLPDRPVSFACPHCTNKVVVDKRQWTDQPATEPPVAPDPPAEPAAEASPASSDRRFPDLPEGASLPSGIILGEDETVILALQQRLADVGSQVERVSSAEVARELIINEQPDLCIYVGGKMPAPPYAPMAPLTGLPPDSRRRLYLVLVSDNVKTLDGNAAFLYQVNMTLWKQDLERGGAAIHSGIDFHERLYRPYFEAAEHRAG